MKPHKLPDAKGHYGKFGGKYVIETLMPALKELQTLYEEASKAVYYTHLTLPTILLV